MGKYRSLSSPALRSLWEKERDRLASIPESLRDYSSLYEMRRELERREGDPLPRLEVNYEGYLTD